MIDTIILWGLITGRLSILLVRESAPFNVLGRLRYALGVREIDGIPDANNVLGKLLTCVWCLSMWIGFAIAFLIGEPWYYGLAFSMVAMILDDLT